MLKKILSFLFPSKVEDKNDEPYPFCESMRPYLPTVWTPLVALDYVRFLMVEFNLSMTEVEVLLYISTSKDPLNRSDIEFDIFHISFPNARRILRKLHRLGYVHKVETQYGVEQYGLTHQARSILNNVEL